MSCAYLLTTFLLLCLLLLLLLILVSRPSRRGCIHLSLSLLTFAAAPTDRIHIPRLTLSIQRREAPLLNTVGLAVAEIVSLASLCLSMLLIPHVVFVCMPRLPWVWRSPWVLGGYGDRYSVPTAALLYAGDAAISSLAPPSECSYIPIIAADHRLTRAPPIFQIRAAGFRGNLLLRPSRNRHSSTDWASARQRYSGNLLLRPPSNLLDPRGGSLATSWSANLAIKSSCVCMQTAITAPRHTTRHDNELIM